MPGVMGGNRRQNGHERPDGGLVGEPPPHCRRHKPNSQPPARCDTRVVESVPHDAEDRSCSGRVGLTAVRHGLRGFSSWRRGDEVYPAKRDATTTYNVSKS